MGTLSAADFRDKVLGCWLGKNIGGTVGAPFEWYRQINSIDFYPQKDLNGQAMPNDDLDLQLLWLCALEERGIDVDSRRLAEYWLTYITPHWCEYGTAKTNLRQGLVPPFSGTYGNIYKHSCGAYIRSEIWACIAPGLPGVAAAYAYEDAIVDHGDGEGTLAEVFMAAMESAAFFVSDLKELIAIGLSYIPRDCGVAAAVHTTLRCFDEGMPWQETRDEILRHHRGGTPFGSLHHTSEEDRAKGFHEGVRGYDVPSNIAITLLGLLYGGEDFGAVQCTAVNCGEDTDCTAATAGALWGIIHGASKIPQRWIDPIGRGIKTVCLNLGELGYFGNQLPATVDELTDRTIRVTQQVLSRHGRLAVISGESTGISPAQAERLKARDEGASIWQNKDAARYSSDLWTAWVSFGPQGPVARSGQDTTVRVKLHNTSKTQLNISLHWYLPEGWEVAPGQDGYLLNLPQGMAPAPQLEFKFRAPQLKRSTHRAVLEITCEGRHSSLLIPVTLLNGDYLPAEPVA